MKVGFIVYSDMTEIEFVCVHECLSKVKQLGFSNPPENHLIGVTPEVPGWNGIMIRPHHRYPDVDLTEYGLLVVLVVGRPVQSAMMQTSSHGYVAGEGQVHCLVLQRGAHPRSGGFLTWEAGHHTRFGIRNSQALLRGSSARASGGRWSRDYSRGPDEHIASNLRPADWDAPLAI
jgi:hypothetical protein